MANGWLDAIQYCWLSAGGRYLNWDGFPLAGLDRGERGLSWLDSTEWYCLSAGCTWSSCIGSQLAEHDRAEMVLGWLCTMQSKWLDTLITIFRTSIMISKKQSYCVGKREVS
jgi:hypothetical protein